TLPAWLPEYPNPDSVLNVNFNGYVHFHSRRKPGYLYLVNDQGKVVWYKSTPLNIKVSKFTKESTFLTILSDDTLKFSSGRQIAEIDLFGQLLYHFDASEKGSELVFHHEINYDEDGNIVSLIYDRRAVDLSGIGGNVKDTVRGDGILVMNKQDSVIWKWSVFDVMHPKEYPNILNEKEGWLHANALCKDSIGNYVISFRNNSQIWKVDKENGKIIWKLGGEDSDFELPDSLLFYGQHNIRFNKQGHLELLDNGNKFVKPGLVKSLKKSGTYRKKYRDAKMEFKSRQLTFEIDEINMKVKLVDEVCFPTEYFTNSQGSSEYINENLVLFCSTNSNNIVFTNKQGVKLGSIPLQYESYRAQYIPELYETNYVK
ncbi:MAG: aryl-sulfate sulfotransferase, partial [Bacteroidales bacterium]|nr:aryl-sulfate sulfotransferase [Bacteroidales bacterium]